MIDFQSFLGGIFETNRLLVSAPNGAILSMPQLELRMVEGNQTASPIFS